MLKKRFRQEEEFYAHPQGTESNNNYDNKKVLGGVSWPWIWWERNLRTRWGASCITCVTEAGSFQKKTKKLKDLRAKEAFVGAWEEEEFVTPRVLPLSVFFWFDSVHETPSIHVNCSTGRIEWLEDGGIDLLGSKLKRRSCWNSPSRCLLFVGGGRMDKEDGRIRGTE